jgi:hypothetical protein
LNPSCSWPTHYYQELCSLCRFLWPFLGCSSCAQGIFLVYKQLQVPNFSPRCLVTPGCLWGASVGVAWKGACVLHGAFLIFAHVFLTIFSWCFEGIFLFTFHHVVYLNLSFSWTLKLISCRSSWTLKLISCCSFWALNLNNCRSSWASNFS